MKPASRTSVACRSLILALLIGILTGCGGAGKTPWADVASTVLLPETGETDAEFEKETEGPDVMEPRAKVSAKVMQQTYEKLKTPYKYGAVMKLEDRLCDSPSVFYHDGAWYMSFIQIDRNTASSGYESYLAKSDDLLRWEVLFPIFERTEDDFWDARQRAAYAAFVENDLAGGFALQKVNGKYYFSYLGGNLNGYETDPLQMGELRVTDLLDPATYERFEEPILSPFDADSRPGERKTLFKSDLFIDEVETLGHRYVNVYNAKDSDDVETVFLAVSDDGEHWTRCLDHAVFSEPGSQITGDPIILRDGDLYIMIYFVLKDGKTYNTFAASYDLVNWTRWKGKPLIESEYEWENVYAHKASLVRRDGVLYHFYCAVNRQGERFIAVAASEQVW